MESKILKLAFALLALSLFSCENESLDSDDCDFDTALCTLEFRTISLEIFTTEGNPVTLDYFYTFYDSRKKFEYTLDDPQVGTGIYPVITDAEIDEIEKDGATLIFVGEKDGVNVVEHQMVIGHDCCHVFLIQGEDKIVIEL